MARYVRRGAGLTERLEKVPETQEEAIAAFEAFAAQIPVAQPGDWMGDALMRENAKRCREILAKVGLQDNGTAAVDRRALNAAGSAEGSAAWIAAHWLAEYHTFLRCRERIADGDTSARNLARMVMAAHEMGRLQSELVWRPGVDPKTGKAREYLALRGQKQIVDGKNTRVSFKDAHGARAQKMANEIHARNPRLTWAVIREKISKEFKVSDRTIKEALTNPKKSGQQERLARTD